MKNIDKFMNDIIKQIHTNVPDCICIINPTTVCDGEHCTYCQKRFYRWLADEYKEIPMLSKTEYEILKQLPSEYEWIARDSGRGNNEDQDYVAIYTTKPFIDEAIDPYSWYTQDEFEDLTLLTGFFKFVKWGDKEPHMISELIKAYEEMHSEVANG